MSDQLEREIDDALGNTSSIHQLTGEDEERNRQQRETVCPADQILGHDLEIDQIEVENLVPEKCRGNGSLDDFFLEMEKADSAMESLLGKAASEGKRLCYIASLRDGKARTGLEAIGSDHPFFGLAGSDNIIAFTTDRYSTRPLVVKGPGAGPEVTAAGVFADIIRIAHQI